MLDWIPVPLAFLIQIACNIAAFWWLLVHSNRIDWLDEDVEHLMRKENSEKISKLIRRAHKPRGKK